MANVFYVKPSNCLRPIMTLTITLVFLHWLRVPERDLSPVQGRISGVQSFARTRAAIPRSAQLRRRLTWSPTFPFCWHQPSGSASGQVDNRHQTTWHLPSRCSSFASVSGLISLENHFLDCTLTNLFSGPSRSSYYLGHFKNFGLIGIDLLIDFL